MKFTEQIDQANQITEEFTAKAIASVRLKARPEQVRNADGTWPELDCIECGETLPEGRLNLGKVRCIDCQIAKERKSA